MSAYWTKFGGWLWTVSECKAKWTQGNWYVNGEREQCREPKWMHSDCTVCACLMHGNMGK